MHIWELRHCGIPGTSYLLYSRRDWYGVPRIVDSSPWTPLSLRGPTYRAEAIPFLSTGEEQEPVLSLSKDEGDTPARSQA